MNHIPFLLLWRQLSHPMMMMFRFVWRIERQNHHHHHHRRRPLMIMMMLMNKWNIMNHVDYYYLMIHNHFHRNPRKTRISLEFLYFEIQEKQTESNSRLLSIDSISSSSNVIVSMINEIVKIGAKMLNKFTCCTKALYLLLDCKSYGKHV